MNNRVLAGLAALLIVLSSTACSSSSEKPREQTTEVVQQETPKAVETKVVEKETPKSLYPAFIMEGSDKKWGYIDETGSFVIKPQYNSAEDFRENALAKVSKNFKYGLIDKQGKYVLQPEYDNIDIYNEGFSSAYKAAFNSFLIDVKGGIVFRTEGFIGEMKSGLASFSKKLDTYKYAYGYVNSKGQVVIEPKYENAEVFTNDRAIVKIGEGNFGIIDSKGNLLKELQAYYISDMSEDTFIFSKAEEKYKYTYGYMDADGNIQIDAKFSSAGKFQDGLAVVNTSEEHGEKYGVINKKGEFVISPEYPQITYLGKGIFAIPVKSRYSFNTLLREKALFDKNGKQLTEYRYYDLEMLENGLISATDDKNTFIIDKAGNEVKGFPKIEGIGSIKQSGKLFKADVDNDLSYFGSDGKVIWKSDSTVRLDGDIKVRRLKFRPDRCTYIEYPEIAGITDLNVQEELNGELKKLFIGDHKASKKEDNMYTEDFNLGYSSERNKDLLIVNESGYYYPIGAAHGQPLRAERHINIKSGRFYTLEDLFKKGSGYEKILTELMKKKIKKANDEVGRNIYSENIELLGKNTGFKANKDSLLIYFQPYEIASYAQGFPEFDIDYKEIMDVVNTEGEFWKSFERGKTTGNSGTEINQDEKEKVEDLMKGYENSMMEAIGENDFSLVMPWLYPDSSLYNSQKKLVENLNEQGIKEKLESYNIKDIKRDNRIDVFRVYVTENVSIQYPGKDYVTKQFDWVYSMIYSYDDERYRLTFIEKWDGK